MKIAVIGGGITGLTAGYEAAKLGADVTVYEATKKAGGRIRTSNFAGQLVDEGPDAFLARVSWATDLCIELGLESELVSPAHSTAYVYSYGALRAIPSPNILGVPLDLDALAASQIVSPQGVARARQKTPLANLAAHQDISVGQLIRQQLGDEVATRLIDPLLGGIHAANIDDLSLRAAAPQLGEVITANKSLVSQLKQLTSNQTDSTYRASATSTLRSPKSASKKPVFLTLAKGLGRLVDELAARLGPRLQLATPVSNLKDVAADHIIVTTPAPTASTLLATVSPAAAELLGSINYASVVLVTLAYNASEVAHPMGGSGYLVPAVENCLITACSWASSKWAHVGGADTVVLRTSAGRYGDNRAMKMSDTALIDAVTADLAKTMGLGTKPQQVRISRWEKSLPQFRPGHLELVNTIQQTLTHDAGGLQATGAWARGLGIAACINQGRQAAQACLADNLAHNATT